MEVLPTQMVDISSGEVKLVDKPTELKTGDAPPAETPKDAPADPPKEEPKKEEPLAVDAPKEEPKKEEPPTNAPKDFDINAYLKEKHGLDSEDDLKKVLEYNQTVKEELEAGKKKEPAYKSDKAAKIASFLDGYDLNRLGDGLETAASLMGMDVDKIDDRKALEEAYILSNTELTREEAKKLYTREYRDKYEPKEEDFEEKSAYQEEKEYADIKKKKDVAQARKFLNSKKEELKYTEPEKPAEAKKEEPVSKETIGGYSSQIHKVLDDGKGNKFDRMDIQVDPKDPDKKITVLFTADELKQLKEDSVNYLRDSRLYNGDKKIPNFDPRAHVEMFAQVLFGPKKQLEIAQAAYTLGKSLRAEQIAGVKPDKESKGKGEEGIASIEDQFGKLALEKQKAKNR